MLKGAVTALAIIGVAGFFSWFFVCPCDRLSGGYLLGAVADEQVADWSFANDVRLCQVEFSTFYVPHSINLNCMATTRGDLYLSCSQCAPKHWSNVVLENPSARLRLNDTVYPVTLTRVTDPVELDHAWSARLTKLHTLAEPANPPPPVDTPRPDHWWSFRVDSRS